MVAVTVILDFPDPPPPAAAIPAVSPVRGVTLSNDALLVGAAENTVVGTFSHAQLTSVTLNDTQGGRFKMVGNVLTVAAVVPDFLDHAYGNGGNPVAGKERGLAHYEPIVTLNMSAGGNEVWTVRIRPRFSVVSTVGGDSAAVTLVTDLNRDAAAGLTTLWATGSNKRVRFASGLNGAILGGTSIVPVTGSDKTLETPPDGLPPRVVFLRKAPYRSSASRMIYRGLVFAVGNEAGGVSMDTRDAHMHLTGSDVIYDHCSFLFSVDELMSVKNTTNYSAAGVDAPRRISYLDCAFIHPLYNAGHSENLDHDYGMLIGERGMHVDLINCLWIDTRHRSPQLARVNGIYQQNNVIGCRSQGFTMNTPGTGLNSANFQTYLGVNNLYIYHAANTGFTVTLYSVGSNSWACLEGARVGTHANKWGVPFDRTDIRTNSDASSHVLLLNGATAASIVDDRPFEPPDYPNHPVLALANSGNATTIFNSVMDNAGARARTLPEGGWLTGDANVPAPIRQYYTDFRAGTRYTMSAAPAAFWTGF